MPSLEKTHLIRLRDEFPASWQGPEGKQEISLLLSAGFLGLIITAVPVLWGKLAPDSFEQQVTKKQEVEVITTLCTGQHGKEAINRNHLLHFCRFLPTQDN